MNHSTLCIGVALTFVFGSDAGSSDRQAGVIVVEASYPGANAHVVADTVAAPIEQQVNGIEKLLQIASRSTDGKYVLTVSFKTGTDLKAALAVVQQRAALAEPNLPTAVRQNGITAKIKTPILLIASLSSTNGVHNALQLSGVASTNIKEELARLPGVGEVAVLGGSEPRLQVHIDPDHLRARNLTAGDVVKAVRSLKSTESAPAAPGDLLSRLKGISQIEDVVVQATPEGQVVRLKDVARIELGASQGEFARVNGEPCVAIAVSPTVDANIAELSRTIENKLNDIRPSLPEGMKLELAFDFSANFDPNRIPNAEYLLLELQFPAGVSREQITRQMAAAEVKLRNAPAVKELMSLTANPFDVFGNDPCILIRLSPAHERKISSEEAARIIHKNFESLPGLLHRLRSIPKDVGRSFDLAVQGEEPPKVRELSEKFAARLRESESLVNVVVDHAGVLAPRFEFEVDRLKTKAIRVSLDDLAVELEIALGPMSVQSVEGHGRKTEFVVNVEGETRERSESLRRQSVRGDKGLMVPLGSLVALRTIAAPTAVDRIGLKPATRIAVDAATEALSAKTRSLFEAQFEVARRELNLTTGYSLLVTPP